MAQQHVPREVLAVVQVADVVSKKVKYPVQNFQQLAKALGGEGAQIDYEGQKRTVGEVKRMIPGEFFPISSREDLITKIVHLQSIMRPDWAADGPAGTELKDRPTVSKPTGQPAPPPPGKVVGVRGFRS